HRELTWIANVHRARYLVTGLHYSNYGFDHIIHVAKTSRLLAVAVDRDILPLQCLHNEVRHHSAVIQMHARSISIKDARHLYAQSVLTVVVKEQRFSAALAFVVTAAHPNWIDAAAIAFDLWVDFRIAVHFARRRLQYLGTQTLGEP